MTAPSAPVAAAAPVMPVPVMPAPGAPVQKSPAPGAPGGVPTPTLLQMGDAIIVTFSDIPTPLAAFEDTIKEDGTITLAYDQKFYANGKTIGALQQEIRDRYVPKYWKYLTVGIKIQDRYYFVSGEVKSEGRQVYVGTMTVLKAITTVGGYTDFAAKTRVTLTRADGTKLKENCKKALVDPSLDLPVYPGDRIYVPKRWF